MDILDIVIAVLIIVGTVLFSGKKNSKKTPAYEPYYDEENSEWNEPVDAPEWKTIVQKTSKNVPNSYFYGDFEKIENREKEILKIENIEVQDAELENEIDEPFSISHDDMRKAVIYSEILKASYIE